MNKIFTLRSLAIFSFVIFLLPFMRTCSDDSLKSIVKKEVRVSENSVQEITTDDEYKLSIAENAKDYTFNFYTLSVVSLDDFKLKNLSDGTFWSFFGFTVILILSILILFFSFKNKFKAVYRLGFANLLILFISTLIFCLTEIIESINQIKIGYYLFVLNSVAIVFFSKKLQREKEIKRASNF